MNKQKRALAVHDISCAGRCSITVALPLLSAAGIETVILPTSLLSTHTGGFEGYTFMDLTGEIPAILRHWETLQLDFDAVYSGYLGSFEQIAMVEDIFRRFAKKDALLAVDPVMADNGKLYAGFSEDYPARMRQLCSHATLIMPNITEATLMLGEPYQQGPYTREYIYGLLERLSGIGAGRVVLTGVHYDEQELGAAVWDKEHGVCETFSARIPGYYHGTGDIFGSVLVGSMLAGKSLPDAAAIAVELTAQSIRLTDEGADTRFGVRFEGITGPLVQKLGLI